MKPEIAGYEVLSLLGNGAMSAVWKARQLDSERLVALKILHPYAASSPNVVDRFLCEARAYERLRHPNIVSSLSSGRDGERWFLALELLEGGDLRALIRSAGRLPPGTASFVLGQLLEGLRHAHTLGFWHRDIKPENIMVSLDGVPKLADFGIATGIEVARLTEMGQLVGTPAYMAPESLRDVSADERSDLWSAGVLLYEMVCGGNPFAAATREATVERLRSLSPSPMGYRVPGVPAELDELAMRMLTRDVTRRVQTAGEAIDAVLPIVQGSGRWGTATALVELLRRPQESVAEWVEVQAAGRLGAARSLLSMPEPRHAGAFLEAAEASWIAPESGDAAAMTADLAPRVGARLDVVKSPRVEELEREAEESPANVQALVQLVRTARASGDVLLAARAYRWGRSRSGGDRFAFAQLASALGFELAGHIEGRRPESLRSVLQGTGVPRRPDDGRRSWRSAWLILAAVVGLVMLSVGRWARRLDADMPGERVTARSALRDEGEAERAAYLAGARKALDCGDAERARITLLAFRERWPRDSRAPEALFLLGGALEQLGSNQAAAEVYADLLARHPQDDRAVAARRRLARSRAELGQFDVAVLELEPLRDRGDVHDRAAVRLELGDLCARLGRDDESLVLYQQVLDEPAVHYLHPRAARGRERVVVQRGDRETGQPLRDVTRPPGPDVPVDIAPKRDVDEVTPTPR